MVAGTNKNPLKRVTQKNKFLTNLTKYDSSHGVGQIQTQCKRWKLKMLPNFKAMLFDFRSSFWTPDARHLESVKKIASMKYV
jgi:hypothetical protein